MSYPASTKQVRLAAEANLTLYVDAAAGSDSTGRGTQAQPFASIAAAMEHLRGYDGRGHDLVIQVAAGTYGAFVAGEWLNSWQTIQLLGDVVTPSNCKITAAGQLTLVAHFKHVRSPVYMTGFRVYGAGDYEGNLITLDGCLSFWLCKPDFTGKMEFGDAYSILALQGGNTYCYVGGTFSILAGSAVRFVIFTGLGPAMIDFYPDMFETLGNVTSNFAWFVAAPNAYLIVAPSEQSIGGTLTGSVSRVSALGNLGIDDTFRDALTGAGMTAMADSAVNSALTVIGGAACLGPRTKAQIAVLAGRRKGSLAYCTDEAGGEVLVFYDGTNWRRVTDRAIMS